MDRLPKPIDPAILKEMLNAPDYSTKSIAELACLIATGFDILEEQKQMTKGRNGKRGHYHLPLNHEEAKRAAERYLKISRGPLDRNF